MITRTTAINNLREYIGQDLFILAPKLGIQPFKDNKQNKGWKGQVLELCAGLTNGNEKAPNGLGFELKSTSFVEKKSQLVPKETIAITMINEEELLRDDFYNSHCWSKLKSLVLCSVKWTEPNQQSGATFLEVTSFDFQRDIKLLDEIEADYEYIRDKLKNQGFKSLTGRDGKWIQSRTKGPGGTSKKTGLPKKKTRAFYARVGLVRYMFENSLNR